MLHRALFLTVTVLSRGGGLCSLSGASEPAAFTLLLPVEEQEEGQGRESSVVVVLHSLQHRNTQSELHCAAEPSHLLAGVYLHDSSLQSHLLLSIFLHGWREFHGVLQLQ